MSDEQMEDLAVRFEQEREYAIKNGWNQPKTGGNRTNMVVWINYWLQMKAHDKKVAGGDKNPGRPVIPHRSG